MTDKLKVINGGNKPDPKAEAVRKLQESMAKDVAAFQALARFRNMQFEAYKKAGFTPEEALKLVMKIKD